MVRIAREKSRTGIYHIMMRGIDKRNIFLDDEDRGTFLYYLFRAKKISGFQVYGYCLMTNHVHLLIQESEEIGKIIKRITVGYVQWHNNKNGRTGHLFQNRYKSEAVEDERYLIAVLRYIHQNPVKAKIVEKIEDYNWSSYKDYILSYNGKETNTDTEIMMDYFSTQRSFKEYMSKPNDDRFLDYEEKKKYTDEELKRIISNTVDIKSINKLPKKERDKIILNNYKTTGASIRQLSRSMEISRGVIENAIKS